MERPQPQNLIRRLQLNRHAQRLRQHVSGLVGLLDSEGGPIRVSEVQSRLRIGPKMYTDICRSLLINPQEGIELYLTQEGVVLKRDATDEHRLWHLSWCLGSHEVSGMHLALDEDLMRRMPQMVETLITEGRLNDARRVRQLIGKAIRARGTSQTVTEMYGRIEGILRAHLRQLGP